MKVIIISRSDIASCNIFENLIQLRKWKKEGEFLKEPLYFHEDFCIAMIPDEHIFHDNVDEELKLVVKVRLECIIYASRHRSESGKRSLTVHPIGNFGSADYGGREKTLVPSSPQLMTEALRLLRQKARGLDYTVSFEATHHGPYLSTPTFFIEIGSDEDAWREREPAMAIAEAIMSLKNRDYPVGVGVGGGHYAPRITDVALERKISFGHIVPTYAIEHLTEDMARMMVSNTAYAENAYFHRKRLKGGQYSALKELFDRIGLRSVRTADIEPLDNL